MSSWVNKMLASPLATGSSVFGTTASPTAPVPPTTTSNSQPPVTRPTTSGAPSSSAPVSATSSTSALPPKPIKEDVKASEELLEKAQRASTTTQATRREPSFQALNDDDDSSESDDDDGVDDEHPEPYEVPPMGGGPGSGRGQQQQMENDDGVIEMPDHRTATAPPSLQHSAQEHQQLPISNAAVGSGAGATASGTASTSSQSRRMLSAALGGRAPPPQAAVNNPTMLNSNNLNVGSGGYCVSGSASAASNSSFPTTPSNNTPRTMMGSGATTHQSFTAQPHGMGFSAVVPSPNDTSGNFSGGMGSRTGSDSLAGSQYNSNQSGGMSRSSQAGSQYQLKRAQGQPPLPPAPPQQQQPHMYQQQQQPPPSPPPVQTVTSMPGFAMDDDDDEDNDRSGSSSTTDHPHNLTWRSNRGGTTTNPSSLNSTLRRHGSDAALKPKVRPMEVPIRSVAEQFTVPNVKSLHHQNQEQLVEEQQGMQRHGSGVFTPTTVGHNHQLVPLGPIGAGGGTPLLAPPHQPQFGGQQGSNRGTPRGASSAAASFTMNIAILGAPQTGKSSLVNSYRLALTHNTNWPMASVGICGKYGTTSIEGFPNNPLRPTWMLIDTPGKIYRELDDGGSDDSVYLSHLFAGVESRSRILGRGALKITELPPQASNSIHHAIIVVNALDLVQDKGALRFNSLWTARYQLREPEVVEKVTNQLQNLIEVVRDLQSDLGPFIVVSHMDVLCGGSTPSFTACRQLITEALSLCVPQNCIFFVGMASGVKTASSSTSAAATPAADSRSLASKYVLDPVSSVFGGGGSNTGTVELTTAGRNHHHRHHNYQGESLSPSGASTSSAAANVHLDQLSRQELLSLHKRVMMDVGWRLKQQSDQFGVGSAPMLLKN